MNGPDDGDEDGYYSFTDLEDKPMTRRDWLIFLIEISVFLLKHGTVFFCGYWFCKVIHEYC